LEGDGGKQIKMSLPNLGQDRESSKGSNMTLHYDASNAVVMPAGDLASE
jgi:spermidine/putrescine transport system ATP-binding protein